MTMTVAVTVLRVAVWPACSWYVQAVCGPSRVAVRGRSWPSLRVCVVAAHTRFIFVAQKRDVERNVVMHTSQHYY